MRRGYELVQLGDTVHVEQLVANKNGLQYPRRDAHEQESVHKVHSVRGT